MPLKRAPAFAACLLVGLWSSGAAGAAGEVTLRAGRAEASDVFDAARAPYGYDAATVRASVGARFRELALVGAFAEYSLGLPNSAQPRTLGHDVPDTYSYGAFVGAIHTFQTSKLGAYRLGVDVGLGPRIVSFSRTFLAPASEVTLWSATVTAHATRMWSWGGLGLWVSARRDLTSATAQSSERSCDSSGQFCMVDANAIHVGGQTILGGLELIFARFPGIN